MSCGMITQNDGAEPRRDRDGGSEKLQGRIESAPRSWLQRSGSAIQRSSLKNLRPKSQDSQRRSAWPLRRECNRETRGKKSSVFRKINSCKSTEGNEGNKDGSPPSLSSLASVQTSSVARRRTSELTHRRRNHEHRETKRQNPGAKSG